MSKRFYSREFTNYIDNPNINKSKINSLFNSIINLDTNEIRNVASRNHVPINVSDDLNENLIHKVLQDDTKQKNEDNRLNVIKFLVENGTNPDQPNYENITPLHLASARQYKKIIEYLLSLDVNVDYPDNLGNTPFHYYLNGLVKNYVNNHIFDLIPEDRTTEEINTSKEIREIEKLVWNDISDNSGISAIKETMNYTFLLNDNIKDSIDRIFSDIIGKGDLKPRSKSDLKDYKEKTVQLYSSIVGQLKSDKYWNNFRDIDNIKLDLTNKSYLSGFTTTEDYCRSKINNSIDNIKKGLNNDDLYKNLDKEFNSYLYEYSNRNVRNLNRDIQNHYKNFFKRVNLNDRDLSSYFKPNNKNFHILLGILNKIEKNDNLNMMDLADNWMVNNKFIGGPRVFDISNTLNMDDVSSAINNNTIYQKLSATMVYGDVSNLGKLNSNNLNSLDLSDASSNALHELFYTKMFTNSNFINHNKLDKFDKNIYNRNFLNSNGSDFNKLYNIFTNNSKNPDISFNRLEINKTPIESILAFSGYNNFKNNQFGDLNLAVSQAFRPFYLNELLNIDSNNLQNGDKAAKFLSIWIYLLLTNETNDKLNHIIKTLDASNNTNDIYIDNFSDNDVKTIAKYCYQLLNNTMGGLNINNEINKDMSNICDNKEFESRYEKLVYGISNHYNKMNQKPSKVHVEDTIFIIRQIADELLSTNNVADTIKNVVEKYLHTLCLNENLDVNNYENYICPNKNNNANLFGDASSIYQAFDNVLPSRRLLYLNLETRNEHDSSNVNDSYKNYYLKKFRESYLLGHEFLCCFERVNTYFEMDYGNDVNIRINNRSYNFRGNIKNNLSVVQNLEHRSVLPYAGFLKESTSIHLNNSKLIYLREYVINQSDGNKKDYFAISNETRELYRPSTGENFKSTFNMLFNLIGNSMKSILGLDNYSYDDFKSFNNPINFREIIDSYKRKISSNKLTKLIPLYYPVLNGLISQFEKLEPVLNKLTNNKKIIKESKSYFNNVINEINSINAYYFINYYSNHKDENIYIPSFFYYKIPTSQENEYSLLFDSDLSDVSDSLEIKSEYRYGRTINDASDYSGNYWKTDTKESGNSNKSMTIEDILDNKKYVTTNSIKKYMKISKRSPLPPSLKGYFYDFYKLNTLEMIKNVDSSNLVQDKITDLNNLYKFTPKIEELDFKYKRAKVIEGITKRHLEWKLKNNVVKLIDKFYRKNGITDINGGDYEMPYLFEDTNFEVSLDNIPTYYSDLSSDNYQKRGSGLNIYRINEKLKECDDFIIYSNDYTTNSLERNYSKMELNEEIIVDLLNYGANPYIKNEMNRTAIKNVLLNYYYPIFKKISEEKLSYNLQQFIDINDNKDLPHIYILEELYNHSNKLTFNYKKNRDILEKFTFAQYNEIELIVRNNEKFGNNILRNLELSYSVVGYLMNQFLFRSLFSTSYGDNNTDMIKNLINDYDISDLSNNVFKINDLIGEKTIYSSDYRIAIEEYAEKLGKEIDKLTKEINVVDTKKGKLGTYTMIDNTLDEERNRLNDIKTEKENLKNKIETVGKSTNTYAKTNPTSYNILGFYDDLIKRNNYNRGAYMELWKTFLESDITDKKDINMFILDKTKDLAELAKGSINIGGLNGEDKLLKILPIFDYLEKMGDIYFKTPKYTEINKPLDFMKNVLIHMTQNVICFGFEVSVRKCLFEYFINKMGDSNVDMIYSMIDSAFVSIMRKDNADMRKILYEQVAEDLVINSTSVFPKRNDEVNHSMVSPKEIYINYINLLSASQFLIEDDSKLMKNLNVIVNYFDSITSNTINRWHVVMENYLKFSLNQSRILKSIKGLYELKS